MEKESWNIMKGNEELLKRILEEERRKRGSRTNVSIVK
jgi:hypothetical protein